MKQWNKEKYINIIINDIENSSIILENKYLKNDR